MPHYPEPRSGIDDVRVARAADLDVLLLFAGRRNRGIIKQEVIFRSVVSRFERRDTYQPSALPGRRPAHDYIPARGNQRVPDAFAL